MSFQSLTGSGNGVLEFRLELEGYDYQWVSNESMAQYENALGPIRTDGLLRDGLGISESIVLTEGKLETAGFSARIVDVDGLATRAFARYPNIETRLMETITYDQTTIYVADHSGFEAGDFIYVGTEAMWIVSKGDWGELEVLRGQMQSQSQAHWVSNSDQSPKFVLVTECPISLERRMARLYAYGEHDDLQGPGTCVWRGIVETDPIDEDGIYSIGLGGISRILESDIGGLGGKIPIRGIYIPSTLAFEGRISVLEGGNMRDDEETGPAYSYTWRLHGFFPTFRDFEREFDRQLRSATIAWPFQISSQTQPGQHLGIVFNAEIASLPRAARIAYTRGPLLGVDADNTTALATRNPSTDRIPEVILDAGKYEIHPKDAADGFLDSNEALPSMLLQTIAGMRARYGFRFKAPFPDTLSAFIRPELADSTSAATYPGNRIYLDTEQMPLNLDDSETTISVWRHDDRRYFRSIGSISYNTVERWIELKQDVEDTVFCLRPGDYVMVEDAVTRNGNLYNFFDGLIRLAKEKADLGGIPYLSSDEVDLPGMKAAMQATIQHSYVQKRNYIFGGKAQALGDVLAEECKLAGVVPVTTVDGKLSLQKFDFASETENPEELDLLPRIDESNLLNDDRAPTREPNADGIFNVAKLSTKFNPMTDEHEGPTYYYQNGESVSVFRRAKTLEIAPFSYAVNEAEIAENPAIINDVLHRPIELFSLPYAVVEVDVPMTLFGATLGTSVRFSARQVPNTESRARGIENAVGTVVGRAWDLDKGFGTLRILITKNSLSGIAPSGEITSGVDLGSLRWEFDLAASVFAPVGYHDVDYFKAGDAVRAVQFDHINPKLAEGVIESIDGDTLTIEFDSDPGYLDTEEWRIHYAPTTTPTIQADQLRYTHVASGSISLAGLDLAPYSSKKFQP